VTGRKDDPLQLLVSNGLSVPQPDFVEGLKIQAYDPFPVDEHVSGAVLYKDDLYSVTLPHLAGVEGTRKGYGRSKAAKRL
jgi:hypothetical protein